MEYGCTACGNKDNPDSKSCIKTIRFWHMLTLPPPPSDIWVCKKDHGPPDGVLEGVPLCNGCWLEYWAFPKAPDELINAIRQAIKSRDNVKSGIIIGQTKAIDGTIGCYCKICRGWFSWVIPNRGVDYFCPDHR